MVVFRWELINLANKHPRVNILQPGVGVGGHCIAVDPWFLVSAAPKAARLIRTAREVNDSKVLWVVNKIKDAANKIFYASGTMHLSTTSTYFSQYVYEYCQSDPVGRSVANNV